MTNIHKRYIKDLLLIFSIELDLVLLVILFGFLFYIKGWAIPLVTLILNLFVACNMCKMVTEISFSLVNGIVDFITKPQRAIFTIFSFV